VTVASSVSVRVTVTGFAVTVLQTVLSAVRVVDRVTVVVTVSVTVTISSSITSKYVCATSLLPPGIWPKEDVTMYRRTRLVPVG